MTQEELLRRMEALVADSDEWRAEVRKGFESIAVRLTRLETKFDGGIVTVELCIEREKRLHTRLDAQEKRIDGHVTWLRLIGVGIVIAMAGAIIGVALR